MSELNHDLSKSDIEEILAEDPIVVSSKARAIFLTMLLAGVFTFIASISLGDFHEKAAWVSFQVNIIFWTALAASGTVFSAVFQICNAQWVKPIRRLFESCSLFLSFSALFLVVGWFGKEVIFQWATEHIHGKGPWLNPGFVYTRDIIGLLILSFIATKFIKKGLSTELYAVDSGKYNLKKGYGTKWKDSGRSLQKLYGLSLGKIGSDNIKSTASAKECLIRLSPAIVIFYAIIISLIGFDQVMSVDAHWYSTLFGVLVFISGVYASLAWVSILVFWLRPNHPILKKYIQRSTLHDLGKLLFGFGIFWAYMFWSHYLPIWYGNIPEETGWVITRMREEPWHCFSWIVFGMCFIIPFLIGLSRDIKQIPAYLALTGAIVLVGVWLQFYVLIVPTLYPNSIPIGAKDLIIFIGFAGGMLLACTKFLSKVPAMTFYNDIEIE